MAAVGASFVTDVLQKSGRLEKDDLQTSVGKLSQKADDVKVVTSFSTNRLFEFCKCRNTQYES